MKNDMEAAQNEDEMVVAVGAVSYTHLDVYKRQVIEGVNIQAKFIVVNLTNMVLFRV